MEPPRRPSPRRRWSLEELLAGFQALSGAETINEVLTTLVEQMAAQFPRVALFRVRKGHLHGEHQIGFDLKTDINKLVLPLGMDSLPARAASSGQIERLSGNELKDSKTPFSGTPTLALALPIAVAGDTLAIVYADDSGAAPAARGGAADEIRARSAEAIQLYAVALLMRLTNELKALAELQKYAASLLHEMEQMYEADVAAGINGPDLQKRLSGNLDFARSIYGSRTALEGTDAASLIEDELAGLIDARRGTPFAQRSRHRRRTRARERRRSVVVSPPSHRHHPEDDAENNRGDQEEDERHQRRSQRHRRGAAAERPVPFVLGVRDEIGAGGGEQAEHHAEDGTELQVHAVDQVYPRAAAASCQSPRNRVECWPCPRLPIQSFSTSTTRACSHR